MLRDILLSRMYLIGVIFFVVVVSGSLLYSWHIKRNVDEARAARFLQQIENREQDRLFTETFQPTEPTSAAENSEVSVEKRDTTQSFSELPDQTSKPTAATEVEILDETVMEIIAETETTERTLSIEELRRQELLQERASLHEQLKTLVPGGRTVHSSNDPETVLQALALTKQLVQIDEALNGYINQDSLRAIDRAINTTRSLTPNGQLPVIAAEKMADSFQREGKFEVANRMRLVIQNARKNGDAVIKPEHLTVFQ